MLAQNLIPVTLESAINQEDEIPQCRTQLLYRNLVRKVSNSPVLKRFILLQDRSSTTSDSLFKGKSITAKMRTKLIGWLQKLAMETFEFTAQTVLTAIKILDEYVRIANPSPQVLQLTGCACLYLSAKTKEVTIVAGQCYVVAAGGCFTEEQLMEKELQVFKTLGYNTTFSSLFRCYKLIAQTAKINGDRYIREQVEKQLVNIAKNIEFREWRQHRVVCMFVALVQARNQLPQVSDLIDMLKMHQAF